MKHKIDPEKHLDTLAHAMGLEIDEKWRDTVLAHLQNAEKMADILYAAPIADTALHLANTFNPALLNTDTNEAAE